MIHQHKAHDSAILTIIHAYYDMICTIIIRLSTEKKENQVHGNFTNKGWRKASNIISPLFTKVMRVNHQGQHNVGLNV